VQPLDNSVDAPMSDAHTLPLNKANSSPTTRGLNNRVSSTIDAMKITHVSNATMALLLISSYHANAGFAWFQRSTDTIQVAGQTVINGASTYEAVVMLPSNLSGGDGYYGFLFNEWTEGAEDKALTISTNSIGCNNFPNGAFSVVTHVTSDVWHHVAIVDDSTEQRIYLDGLLLASKPDTARTLNSSGQAFVGAIFRDGFIAPSFLGFLDSLRVSGVARYTGDSFVPPTGDMSSDSDTLLLYNLNEPPGSATVTDDSSFARIGTVGFGFAGASSPTFVANSSGLFLRIAHSGTNTIVCWPSVATNQSLHFATNLNAPVSWLPVTNSPVLVGSEFTVPVHSSLGAEYFRLEQP
jgi:hypothetical protein